MTDNVSLADIAAVTKGDDGMFGSGGGLWVLIILIFLLGGNGFGFGGRNAATTEDVASGFSTSTILSNQRELQNSLFGLQGAIDRGFNGVERAIDSCCCTTNRNIDALRYEMAKSTCEIITNANNNTAAIINYFKDDKIHSLELEAQALKYQLSQNAQSQTIIDALKTTTAA